MAAASSQHRRHHVPAAMVYLFAVVFGLELLAAVHPGGVPVHAIAAAATKPAVTFTATKHGTAQIHLNTMADPVPPPTGAGQPFDPTLPTAPHALPPARGAATGLSSVGQKVFFDMAVNQAVGKSQ